MNKLQENQISGDEISINVEEFHDDETEDENYIDSLSEMDVLDMESHVYLYLLDDISSNFLQISNPTFQEKLVFEITDTLYDICGMMDEDILTFTDAYQHIYLFVSHWVEIHITTIINVPRSQISSNDEKSILERTKLYDKITSLQKVYQPSQHSMEWYEFRQKILTASSISKIIGSVAVRNSFIYQKCLPYISHENTYTNIHSPMHWGNKYESVSIMIYEKMFHTRIGELGCIQHPTYHCLAASPDGINIDKENDKYGRLLEIKNVVSREITGIPLEDYWIQMQVQMEVCDLRECDFIETKFIEYEEVDFINDSTSTYKGLILYFTTIDEYTPCYYYMPLSQSMIEEWIQYQKEILSTTHVFQKVIYWSLVKLSCVLVLRNKVWFQAFLPHVLETWDVIQKERLDGTYEHRKPKCRTKRGICQVTIVKEK